MFERLFVLPAVARRHIEGRFAVEREAFLLHCESQGLSIAVIQRLARDLLAVTQYLKLPLNGSITRRQIALAAGRWQRRPPRGRWRPATSLSSEQFVQVATRWLRFLGRLEKLARPHTVFAPALAAFTTYMRADRGLAEATIETVLRHAILFLDTYAPSGRPLASLSPRDIDTFTATLADRGWNRVSVATVLKSLRSFLRYCGQHGWCSPELCNAVVQPRLFRDEQLPVAPSWDDVQRLLARASSDTPRDIRDTAILLLLAAYGLRSSEVRALRIEDLDWEGDRITVRRSKQRRCQQYPLLPSVGAAILRYLQEARPKSSCREVFLTLRAPIHPLRCDSVYHVVSSRLRQMDVRRLRHFGPHALRHACACRLVSEGLSLKEIGDHLGHRSPYATRIYAKVDLTGLREVADVSLGGLL